MKIAVAGASGRMGKMLIEAIGAADDAVLAGALDIAGSPSIGMDAGAYAGQLWDPLESTCRHASLSIL